MHTDSSPAWDLRPFELLREGWRLVKPHYIWVILWILSVATLLAVFSRLPWVGGLGLFLMLCVGNSGLTWFLLRAAHGERVSYKTFLEPVRQQPGQVIALHAIAMGLVLLGLVCLIVPGLYLLVVFELSLPLLLTQDLSPWQALVRSRQEVRRQLGDFIMLSVGLVVLNGIAAFLVLPLLWTLPATCGAAAVLSAQVLGWRSSLSA